jgi:molybdate transport system ATP-binding protein
MMLQVDISHSFGDFSLKVAFTAGPGVTALVGPSGAGKSSVLMAVAGLLRPDAGTIRLGDQVLNGPGGCFVPAFQRGFGVVFQDARLLPHLTVAQNLRYGMRFAKVQGDVAGTADMLGVAHLMARRPRDLSGGERQRVALARALLSSPRLLLMDEPLAGLDAARKAEILPLLERVRDLGTPVLYVTHSEAEVVRLATSVVRLDAGCVIAT